MPALIATEYRATLTWLGRVTDRSESLSASALGELSVRFDGVAGEAHSGLTRASCSRVVSQYPRGTEIRNTRQLSILSAEELAQIADNMGLASVDPSWLGASMVIKGIADFSHVPPSSRLQSRSGTSVTIDMQNHPCMLPAKVIEAHAPGFGERFKQAAIGLRGVTAWVEREGVFRLGDLITLHIPDQRRWAEQ